MDFLLFNLVWKKMPAIVKGEFTIPKLFHSLQHTMTNLLVEKNIFKYWAEITPLLKIRSASYLFPFIKYLYVHIT